MNLPPFLDKYRLAIELGAVALLIVAGMSWWHEHDLRQQMIGKAECERAVGAATSKAAALADQKYGRLLKERDDVIAQADAARVAAAAAYAESLGRLRDYYARLHASAVQTPATATAPAGPEVVRFALADYERFTGTALEVAGNGVDDAIALTECRAWVDKVSAPEKK